MIRLTEAQRQEGLQHLRGILTESERVEAEIRAAGKAARDTGDTNPYNPRSAAFVWWEEANKAV